MVRWSGSRLRMRSLMSPAPGSDRERTSPSNVQLAAPGTQSIRSGVPTMAQSWSAEALNWWSNFTDMVRVRCFFIVVIADQGEILTDWLVSYHLERM